MDKPHPASPEKPVPNIPAASDLSTPEGIRHPEPSPSVDPNALTVARCLHDSLNPLATILFGSRARGDHHDTSDLDILLVTREEPPCQHQSEAEDLAAKLTVQAYGHHLKTHLVWLTNDQFSAEEKYLNSIPTQALLDWHGALQPPGAIQEPLLRSKPAPRPVRLAHIHPVPQRVQTGTEHRHLHDE